MSRYTGARCVVCLRTVDPDVCYKEPVPAPAVGFYMFCDYDRRDDKRKVHPMDDAYVQPRPKPAAARESSFSRWRRILKEG